MEVSCTFCDMQGKNQPGLDHDCIGNLSKMLAAALDDARNADGEEVWGTMSREGLLAIEARVSDVYERMRRLTGYYTDRVAAAEQGRSAVYNVKQEARKVVNTARAAVRERMEDVE